MSSIQSNPIFGGMPLSNMVIRAYIFFLSLLSNPRGHSHRHHQRKEVRRCSRPGPCHHHAPRGGAACGCRSRQGGPCHGGLDRASFTYPAPAPAGRVATVIANIHVQATCVKNIRSVVSVTLDLSSTNYARWCDNVLVTLGHYSLSLIMCFWTPRTSAF
jgi:hypothetical protein